MILEFSMITDSIGEKSLVIFERGKYESPLVIIRRPDIERLEKELKK
jgi:hypothetical protein